MRVGPALCVLACLATAAALSGADNPAANASPMAADAKPELRGILATATEKRFNLSVPNTGHSAWVTVGDTFEGWKLAEYRDADATLVLRRNGGAELDLSLASNQVGVENARASVADAERVLEKMNLEKIVGQAMDPQRKALLAYAQRMAEKAGLKPGSGDAYAEYQNQASAAISAALDPKQMESDIANIYSNVYTKDELSGLSDFFDSAAGQAYATKAPEVQKELQAILVPRIQAVLPQLQALANQGSSPAPSAPAKP